MKNIIVNSLLFTCSIVFTLFLAEVVAQLYVSQIAQKSKLFEPNKITGWKVKPNLEIQRKNANGNLWQITTDQNGFRKIPNNKANKHNAVILGDSFAFGEGINIEYRFDQAIQQFEYLILNTGVMGYGTDQQFLLAQPWLDTLTKGDIVILLTYYNDFFDLARKEHSGRSKPWYQLIDGKLKLNKPKITYREILRDKSFLYAKLASLMSKHNDIANYDISQTTNIYRTLVTEKIRKLADKGINVFLFYHGINNVTNQQQKIQIEQTFQQVCNNNAIHCIDIDQHLSIKGNQEAFLNDGHWNQQGHFLIGEIMATTISHIIPK